MEVGRQNPIFDQKMERGGANETPPPKKNRMLRKGAGKERKSE